MKKILIIILLMVMSACAKKEGTTSSKIKLFSGGHAAFLTSKANNGMILYGRSLDGKKFTKKIDADSVDLMFPNGTWSFYAIAWELVGSANPVPNFAGKTYCGKSPAKVLNGPDVIVQIDLTNANCADSEFSAYSANQISPNAEVVFPRPNFFNCKDISTLAGVVTDYNRCDQNLGANFNKGYATSYKLVAYEFASFGPSDSIAQKKIAESVCVRTDSTLMTGMLDSTDAVNLNNVRIPTTLGNGFAVSVQVFYSPTACDSAMGVDEFTMTPNPRMKIFPEIAASVATNYSMFIQTNAADVCRAPRMNPGVFSSGMGTPSSPFAICTKEQFGLLSSQFTTYRLSSFDLLSDIDFGMAQTSPIGEALTADATPAVSLPYSGTFNGNNHKISNFIINCRTPSGTADNSDVGLFRSLANATIKNLTLNTAVVNCKSGNNIGLLSGSLTNMGANSSLENIKLHGHSEGGSYVGGAIGNVMNQGSGTLNVAHVHVSGDFSGTQWVGGIFGKADGTTGSFTINQSSFKGGIHANNNSSNTNTPVLSYVGGLIGQASGPALSLSEVIVKADQIEGSTTVGGFIGSSSNVSISNSYVEANLKTNGNTDGLITFNDLGGAVGNATGGTFTNVLASYGVKEWNGMNMSPPSPDASIGGLIGRGSATCSTGSFFTGVKHVNNAVACGAQIASLAIAQTQSNYVLWNFATAPIIWTMPDEGNDIPRLAFETSVNPATGSVVENEVPYLKRLCLGNYLAVGRPNPNLICTEAQLRASVNTTGTKVLGRNIYFSDGAYSFQPFPAGVYYLDGAGFGLYNFSFALTNLTDGEGIFKDLQAGSFISNLNVAGVKALGTGLASYNGATAGIFAGINSGTISNVNINSSSIEFLNSSVTSNTSYIGGMVGTNASTGLITLSEASPTVRIQDPTLSGGFLTSGVVAASNLGSILGTRSYGQLERIISCPSDAGSVFLPSAEMYGGFVGLNQSGISEVESEGHIRFQQIGTFTNCSLTYNGLYSPFIAYNSGVNAVVQDFMVRGYFDSSFGSAPAPELFSFNSGSLSRGFLFIQAFDANKVMPQILPATAINWNPSANSGADAISSNPAIAPQATCTPADAGKSYLVTTAYASTNLGPVAANDVVMCRGGAYSVLPMEAKNHVTSSPMTEVFYSVTKPTTGIPTLDAGRYFNTDLSYTTNSVGDLSITHLIDGSLLANAPWNVATDFFVSTGKTWLLDSQMGNSLGEPQLVKAGGNVEQLGPPF